MLNILYDTNALYFPDKLRALASRPNVVMWGSLVSVVETVADIRDEKTFREARSQLRLLREVSPTHFPPDADTLFRMAMALVSDSEETRRWRELAEVVARAESLDELTALDFDAARRQREEHTQAFIEPMYSVMIPSIAPRANVGPDRFNIRLSGDELRRFREFLFSEEGRREVTSGWLARQGWDKLTLPSRFLSRAYQVLEGYYLTYRGYAINLFEKSQKPRGNDALDLDFALSLWQPGWLLVTGDKRLLQAMDSGGVTADRFADIQTIDPEAI